MTASPPQVNGSTRPTMPVYGDWRPITPDPEPVEEQRNPEPEPAGKSELVAQAQAEAIRAKAWADAESQRMAAEAEADAVRTRAEEDSRKLRLANDRTERKAREEQAASEARIAESRKRKADADRAREEADRQAEGQQKSEAEQTKAVAKSGKRWRNVALAFYALCAAVALPVQMNAFYDPTAEYLLIAPVFIEVIALVALVGAAAAVTAGRPHWHYRLVAWAGALTAASINIVHGLAEYDAATAFGTALASIAGPGMWDLHEHGRIRKRDGKPSWRQRRAAKKAAKAELKREAAEEKQRAVEKAAEEKAAEAERVRLAEERQREFEDVWKEAVKIAAAVGSAPDDDTVWAQAHRNIKGCEPGESIESITARRAAERRVEAALTGTPVAALATGRSSQVDQQMPGRSRRGHAGGPTVRGTRQKGDTQKYSPAARNQASIAAKNARQKDQ
ncbi:hypothetical protein [Streptomyces sp. NPDC020747]|uniref:hypothetical protein n=1 Tax=Streptomyces sp. NPDC020747 TaxID=3365086 RepID=UPI003798581E